MSAIPVARPIPRRLKRSKTGWKLEVIRWQPIDRDVFSPISSFVVGDEACLKQLSEVCEDRSIARDAEVLIRGSSPVGTIFELIEGKWTPENLEGGASVLPPSERPEAKDLLLLRNELDALRNRVHELEAFLHTTGVSANPSQPEPESHDKP